MRRVWMMTMTGILLVLLCAYALVFRSGEPATQRSDHATDSNEESARPVAPELAPILTPAPGPGPEETRRWVTVGRIFGPTDEPVIGAEVRAEVHRGAVVMRLRHARTDAAGRCEIDLTEVAEWPKLVRATSEFVAHVHAEGYVPTTGYRTPLFDRTSGATWQWDLRLTPGAQVTGRVVDESGAPLAAEVSLIPEPLPVGTTFYSYSAEDDGRYVFGLPEPGRYRIVAKPVSGDEASVLVTVSARDNVVVPDLIVRGGAFVEGRVVLADGSPVAGVAICRALAGRRPDGFMVEAGMTDEAGRFRIRVPATGRHWIEAVSEFASWEGAECEAGDTNIRIEIDGARLAIRIVDHERNPLPGATLLMTGWPPDDTRSLDALMAGQLLPEEADQTSYEAAESTVKSSTGVLAAYVERGSSWHVVARVPSAIPAEAAIKLSEDQYFADHTLVVGDTVPLGQLAIEFVTQDGKPIQYSAVRLETLSGVALAELQSDTASRAISVPVGRLRVIAMPKGGELATEDRSHLGTFHLPVRRVVDVPARGTLALRLQAPMGGRFRLRVEFPRRSPQREDFDVTVRRTGDPDAPAMAINRWICTKDGEESVVDRLGLGLACVSAYLLEAEDYVLTVRSAVHGIQERHLRILSGLVTDVAIEFP